MARDGVLMIFERRDQHNQFKEFKDRHNIRCLLWNDEWVQDRDKNVAVVDKQYE